MEQHYLFMVTANLLPNRSNWFCAQRDDKSFATCMNEVVHMYMCMSECAIKENYRSTCCHIEYVETWKHCCFILFHRAIFKQTPQTKKHFFVLCRYCFLNSDVNYHLHNNRCWLKHFAECVDTCCVSMQEFSTPIHISIFCCFRIYIAVCNGLFIVCLNWMVGLLTALWHFCHIHTFHTSIVAAENQWRTPTGSAFFLTMFLAKALPTDETTSFRCYNIYFIETFNLNGRWCWRLLEWPNAPHTIPYHFYWLMFVSFEYYAKK